MRDKCPTCGNRALTPHCPKSTVCTWVKCDLANGGCYGYGDGERWVEPRKTA